MRARVLALLLVLSCGGAVAQEPSRGSRVGEQLLTPAKEELAACAYHPRTTARQPPIVDVRLECDVERTGKITRCKIISSSDSRYDESAVCLAELHRLAPGAPDSIIIPLRLKTDD
jgi:hypothetical protein